MYWMNSLDKTDRVIINLKVLATLTEGQRVCARNGQFSVYTPGWTQSVLRWLYSEDRWNNLDEVSNTVNDALRILNVYMNLAAHAYNATGILPSAVPVPTPDASLNFVSSLSRELTNALNGMRALKATYAHDALLLATMDVLIERVQTEVQSAKQLLDTHRPSVALPPLDGKDASGPGGKKMARPS